MASAQDVVVMRRVLAPPKRTAQTPTPTPTPTPSTPDNYYSWLAGAWQQSDGACGSQGTETRTISCAETGGTIVADQYCTTDNSGPRPISSRPATITASCTFSWVPSDWSAPSSCGARTRDVACVRADGTVAADSSCAANLKPATSDPGNCGTGGGSSDPGTQVTYTWSAGAWSGAPACGSTTQTRTVTCQGSDGSVAADAKCTGTKPDASQTIYDTSGCSSQWATGDWSTPAPACGATTETRSVSCMRSDGQQVADAQCTGTRPAATQQVEDHSTCTDGRTNSQPYSWTTGSWGPPSTTCGSATETRTVSCLDDSGAPAAEALCAGAKPSASQTTSETSGCSFSWATGPYGSPQPACGPTFASRTVTCMRSDGTTFVDASCPDPKPSTTEPATDYSACGFSWATDAWSAPSTTCGAATSTRGVYCQRSDGARAADGSCSPDQKPAATLSTYETSGCGVTWNETAWSDPAAACGASSQTRTVTCLRSDGQTVDDSVCAPVGAKPPSTQSATDYSTCSYSWAVGAYSDPSTTCGNSTQTRSVVCQRSDGTTVADSQCDASTRPAATLNTLQTTSCTYSWTPSAWGAATPACGASTHSRTVVCTRSDGTAVADSSCAGTKPVTSEATTDYSTCTYYWSATTWNGAAGCGDTVTQTRNVTCNRSDGGDVTTANANSGYPFCSQASMPAASQPITDYSACSYSWQTTYGQWSSTCSSSATRSASSVCVRQDGVTVADSYCSEAKPASTQTQGVYSSCSYTPTYTTNYTGCTPDASSPTGGRQTSPLASCVRSDGTDVTAANAATSPQYAYCAANAQHNCTVTYTATYSTTYGACSPSTPGGSAGTQTAPLTSCIRSDGVNVTSANASGGYAMCAATTQQACTATYTPTFTYGACTPNSQGATAGTETGTITKCTATDGSNAPTSACSGTSSRTCSGIAYSEAYGTCGGTTAPITSCTTTASDGTTGTVATNLCPANAQTQPCGSSNGACSVPVQGSWDGGTTTGKLTSHDTTGIKTAAAAQSWCNQEAAIYHTRGVCLWQSDGTQPVHYIENDGLKTGASSNLWGSTCTATVTCGAPAAGYWAGSGTFTSLGAATTAAQAQSLCNTWESTHNQTGVCVWNTIPGNANQNTAGITVGATLVTNSGNGFNAAVCQ